jgi:hypothetical protein
MGMSMDARFSMFAPMTPVPARLLYMSDGLAFVQFETRHWPGYRGFSNYVTTAIFAEHLRLEERPRVSGRSITT